MEICTMANHSRFELEGNSQQMLNYDYNELDNAESTVPHGFLYGQLQPQSAGNRQNEYKHYEINESVNNWERSDLVECKQETDAQGGFMQNINDNSNYASDNDFDECYQYACNEVTPLYTTEASNLKTSTPAQVLHRSNSAANQHRMGPYHISSTKNQLPSWNYNPSNACYAQPSGFLQQPYLFRQSGIMSATSAPMDHSMQNMIHMTSRNGREARNRAEKHRRDKLNGSIQELSTMVPHVAESPRRVDKTAVLRFSAHGLRIDYVFANQKPNRYLINPKSTEGLMKLLDTFLLTITCRANVVLISSSVEQYLGHCRSDLYGQSLLNITHPDDHAFLKQQLIPTDLHNLFAAKIDESGEIRSRTQEEEEEIDRKLREDRRDFNIRLARAGPRSEPTVYEVVRIDGCFRRADSAPRGRPTAGPTGLQLIRRSRGRDDNIPLHSVSGNDIVLIAMARIVKPPLFRDRLIEACRYEYKTRHLIDGRIVQCDQRISIVAGYLTEEISGLSPFTFIHKDDVRWVMVALRQMYDFGRPFGESCYRLMSRTGQFIYLKTRGCLEVDEKTRQVHSFVCVNSLVSDEEGRRLIREMKKKFSAIISEAELSALESDVPAVENPQKLERAILNLITNLNNQASYDDDNISMISDSTTEGDDGRRVKSPPLAIIAPKSNTIKHSIIKAVGVMNHVSKGKSPISIKDEPKSPEGFLQLTSQQSSPQTNVKAEPPQNLLSPSSSVHSIDSDSCSPFLSSDGPRAISSEFNSKQLNVPLQILTEQLTSYDNLPVYSNDTTSKAAVTAANDSVLIASNNNNSNVNRNSVLKRVYNSDDDDYSGLIKKRALGSSTQNIPNPSDLLATSVSDLTDLTYPEDSISDQFRYETSPIMQQIDDLNADQDEQREILESLRETCSVIQAPSRNSVHRYSESDGSR